MKKILHVALLGAATILMTANTAFAQVSDKAVQGSWAIFLGAGLGIGIAAFGTGIGMGTAIKGALEGVSRNPSVAPRIMTMMIIGLALIESLAIYALVISILLLMVV
jgi:F-type H+-transporting ATPase subunit c